MLIAVLTDDLRRWEIHLPLPRLERNQIVHQLCRGSVPLWIDVVSHLVHCVWCGEVLQRCGKLRRVGLSRLPCRQVLDGRWHWFGQRLHLVPGGNARPQYGQHRASQLYSLPRGSVCRRVWRGIVCSVSAQFLSAVTRRIELLCLRWWQWVMQHLRPRPVRTDTVQQLYNVPSRKILHGCGQLYALELHCVCRGQVLDVRWGLCAERMHFVSGWHVRRGDGQQRRVRLHRLRLWKVLAGRGRLCGECVQRVLRSMAAGHGGSGEPPSPKLRGMRRGV